MRTISLYAALIITSTSAFSQRPPSAFLHGSTSNKDARRISSSSSSCCALEVNYFPITNDLSISTSLSPSSLHSSSVTPEDDASTTNDFESIASRLFTKDKRPIILFDGVCNLCNGGVNFALDNDSVGKFRFASLQSKTGQSLLVRSGKKASDTSSIVLVTESEAFFKSDAVLRIAKGLDSNPALPLIGTLGPAVPSFVRNVVYDFVARNRYRFGEAEQCRLDFDNDFGSRFVDDP